MYAQPKDIMARKLVAIRNFENLLTARRLMTEKRVRHIPVVNESEEIVGIVSSKDVAVGLEFPHVRIEHVMSSPVEFVTEDANLRDAVYKMLNKKISSLIVVDEQKEAVGILTSDDLLLCLAKVLDEERDRVPWFDAFKRLTVGKIIDQVSAMGI